MLSYERTLKKFHWAFSWFLIFLHWNEIGKNINPNWRLHPLLLVHTWTGKSFHWGLKRHEGLLLASFNSDPARIDRKVLASGASIGVRREFYSNTRSKNCNKARNTEKMETFYKRIHIHVATYSKCMNTLSISNKIM